MEDFEEKYKQEKIAFVSHLTGSTKSDVALVLSIIPTCVLFYRVAYNYYFFKFPANEKQFLHKSVGIRGFIVEYLVLVLPILISMTLTEYTPLLLAFMIITSAMLYTLTPSKPFFPSQSSLASINAQRKPFLDEFRSYMMLSTIIAILAVDFVVFPRRYAKTETFGVSLMDLGVGSVVLSMSLVSKQARNGLQFLSSSIKKPKNPPKQPTVSNLATKNTEYGSPRPPPRFGGGENPAAPIKVETEPPKKLTRAQLVLHSLRASAPLLVIGFARFFLTKSVNYQEHVSEYGLHWNFFFTLSGIAFLVAFINPSALFSLILGSSLMAVYQIALSFFGLEDYIMNHPRDSIFAANKEGLFSLVGYLSIYLLGTTIGGLLFSSNRTLSDWRKTVLGLLLIGVVTLWGTTMFENAGVLVSRRIMNMPYILLVLTYNLVILAIFIGISLYTWAAPSMILSGVNRNQLAIFLFSNLGTGIINISMRTIYASNATSMLVLVCYTVPICIIAVTLDKKNITLRL
eukprot:TRINITY_DN2596_c0_g1_i1.p1 TRINITY_DN2596_c0_g1~~TRINITY_DN2596_c0_g1_i1.p1  ORF type:complete len:515 (+),score=60.02 TRINITY_DN2596_c0_g1_i1:165-1709(+)